MRIPFDSLCLAAVLHELQPLIGAKVQKWQQVNPTTIVAELYAGRAYYLWISWDAEFARLTLGPPPSTKGELSPLISELRKRSGGGRLVKAVQIGFDRLAELELSAESGNVVLITELMGKHSNVMLVDDHRSLISAAKWVGPTRSKRPILPGQPYQRPPTWRRVSPDEQTIRESLSPFLRDRIDDGAITPSAVLGALQKGKFNPHLIPHLGVYPLSTGLPGETPSSEYSFAAETLFQIFQEESRVAQAKASLAVQLQRVKLAREVALSGLFEAADTASRATQLQQTGELILAYGFQAFAGTTALKVTDYAGNLLDITLNPEISIQENADKWFKKAKRAKEGAGEVQEQIKRISEDLEKVHSLLSNLEHYNAFADIEKAREYARAHRWLHSHVLPTSVKEERPYAGHKIKTLQAPAGYTILYGENAEANDYLTLRMGKPNDLWLHVRGNTSTHVLIQTANQPDKVPQEVIKFAAQVAARHSPLKHSSYVPVDYTLKKYVRRPKGAAKGTVFYTHEKTIHVDGGV